MIKKSTVFILGAGASYPYGLPLAKELRTQICFKFANHIEKLLESRETKSWKREEICQEVQEFTSAFFRSSDRSIDVWLVKNPDFMAMGKQAIVSMILYGEHNGDLREKAPYHDQDWYSYLWQRMTDEFTCRDDYNRFSENKVDFITFNYDRSLDHFLFESLKNAFYGISSRDVVEQLTKRKLIHVYGQIASLEWQEPQQYLLYGRNPSEVWPGRFVDNLKIIYEAKDTEEVKEARKLIKEANRIFFLGFGYAKENLEILDLPELLHDEQEIYGTALGMTSNEVENVQNILLEGIRSKRGAVATRRDIKIISMDCLNLLREYL
jgi:hypothetical protein